MAREYKFDDHTTIVLPEKQDDYISQTFRQLTEAIHNHKLADASGYGLGGEFGYGVDFENDVFMIHRYCWCDKDNCLWCMSCTCPLEARIFHYFVDNNEVSFEEWLDFYKRNISLSSLDTNREAISNQINQRRSESCEEYPELFCDFCAGKHEVYLLSGQKGVAAPNFWHKKSGFRVWWYKWIGRDNKMYNPNDLNLKSMFADCFSSLSIS